MKINDVLLEFAPAGSGGSNTPRGPRTPGGDDGSGDDPYSRPEPEYYSRSIDFFGRFEADHFDDEEFDKATGVFKGYWDDAEGRDQIAYFKFDDPEHAGDDDPGMGWYYEPQMEGINEFAADDGDSGGEDDALHKYARMWWAGDEATQMQIERALARMGWEIGEDEGGYDNGGVFVVRAGDENGNSYQSWAAEDLTEGMAEGWREESQDLEDWAKEVNKKLYNAHASQRPALAQQLSQLEHKHFGSPANPLTRIVKSALTALRNGQMPHYDSDKVGAMPFGSLVGDDAKEIAAANLHASENQGYSILKRNRIVDTVDDFLRLVDVVRTLPLEYLFKYKDAGGPAWFEIVKDIGWSKDDAPGQRYRVSQGVAEGPDDSDDYYSLPQPYGDREEEFPMAQDTGFDVDDEYEDEQGMAEGQQMGEYGRVLSAIGLYVPDKFSMEELNTPDWHKVIANKADVPVEYAGKVIDDFTRPVDGHDDDEWPEDDEQGVAEATGTLARARDRLGLNAVPLQRSTDNWNDERDARHQSRLSDIERRTRYQDELDKISLDRERHRLARMQKDDDEWNDTFNAMRDRIRHRSNYQFGRENDPRLEQGVAEAGENIGRKVDAKGRTQSEWMQAVKQKFPDAKIVQAKMIDGPAHALLSDGRKIVWNPVQGVAEVGQNFRRGNARRAALNAMSPEELRAHEDKRAEQQRKRDEARLERERQRNAAKKGVAEAPGAETLAHNQSTVASNEKAFDLEEGKPREKEADYGADYQDMVARVKKLAGLGPLKTVYDPQKRVYKNVPTAVQPKKEQR